MTASPDPSLSWSFPKPARWTARLTWPILVLVFIGLLGGFHPGDVQRDLVLAVATGAIAAVNLPSVAVLIAGLFRRAAASRMAWDAAGLVLRVSAAVAVLRFIGSISHEMPPV